MTLPAFPIFILLVLSVQVGREKNLFLKRRLVFSCTHNVDHHVKHTPT